MIIELIERVVKTRFWDSRVHLIGSYGYGAFDKHSDMDFVIETKLDW